jgi:hypothetical protein
LSLPTFLANSYSGKNDAATLSFEVVLDRFCIEFCFVLDCLKRFAFVDTEKIVITTAIITDPIMTAFVNLFNGYFVRELLINL